MPNTPKVVITEMNSKLSNCLSTLSNFFLCLFLVSYSFATTKLAILCVCVFKGIFLCVCFRGKMGTVGAVAVDINGNIACATSTGGMINKMEGRVGDTPCVGKSKPAAL